MVVKLLLKALTERCKNEYSTTEKVVGKWIDGKPLYEKAFVFTTATGLQQWHEVNHNIQNIDKIFVKNGYLFNADDTATAILSIPDYRTQIGANFGVTVWYKNMPTSIEGHNHKVGIKEDKAIRNYEVDTVEEPEGSHLRWFPSYRNKVRTKIK